MKKVLLTLTAFAAAGSWAVAQNNTLPEKPAELMKDEMGVRYSGKSAAQAESGSVLIWSENFANGIPADWTNQGYDQDANGNLVPNPLADWEFRGPNTTPDNTVGSRGAYASGTGVISSKTPANFVIFDSDYLDNNGDPQQAGQGASPAPHVGTLITDTIDLTGHPFVELSFNSYARPFQADFEIAFSTDGGQTWPDTIQVLEDLAVNISSPVNDIVTANVTNQIGGQANVMISFIFDGTVCNTNGCGYYYWMIDDIQLNDLPDHEFRYANILDSQGDIAVREKRINMYNPNSTNWHPTYGIVPAEEVVPMEFAINSFNYGSATQTNVRLEVEIQQNGATLATLTSPAIDSVKNGDTLVMPDLTTTTSWTPPSTPGLYDIIWRMVSDSIGTGPNAAVAPVNDTMTFEVTDVTSGNYEYGIDWGTVDNYFGTNSGVLSVGVAYDFPDASADTSGYVFIEGINAQLSSLTDTAGTITVEIYDTAGFTYGGSSPGPQGQIFVKAFPMDASIPGTYYHFDLTTLREDGGRDPLVLPAGNAYYFVLSFITSGGSDPIRIANNATIENTGELDPFTGDNPHRSVIFLSSQGGWYAQFTNSTSVMNPIMRVEMFDVNIIDVEEVLARQNAVQVYPNPTKGQVKIELNQSGETTIDLVSITGQTVYSETVQAGNETLVLQRDFSNLPKGVYLMNVSNGSYSSTKKLTIE